MRTLTLTLTLTFAFVPILALGQDEDNKDAQAPGKKNIRIPASLPDSFAMNWSRIGDLEALMSGLLSDGQWTPRAKSGARKIGFGTWGKHLQFNVSSQLMFDAASNSVRKEREFYLAFYREYEAAHGRILEQARALITQWKLLPKVKDLNDKKQKWIKKFLKKYRPGRAVKVSRKAGAQELERAQAISELSITLDSLRRHRPLVVGSLKRPEKSIRSEVDRRQKALLKLLKRYDVKPLAYATNRGSAICDVHLAPAIIKPIRQALDKMRIFPVKNSQHKKVMINGKRQLFICHDYGLAELTKLLNNVTYEYFIARYMERTNDVSKELFRIIGVRLLKGRHWFLIYGDRVVIHAERGFSGR
jgi:hypothetical protein